MRVDNCAVIGWGSLSEWSRSCVWLHISTIAIVYQQQPIQRVKSFWPDPATQSKPDLVITDWVGPFYCLVSTQLKPKKGSGLGTLLVFYPPIEPKLLSNLNNNFDSLFWPVTNLVIQGPSWHSFFQTGDALLEPCWTPARRKLSPLIIISRFK